MWRCLSVALLSALPSSDFEANRPAVIGLQASAAEAASFGASVVPCAGPRGESVHLFVGDQGGVTDAVEEVGATLLELPSRTLIRRVLMPGEMRPTLRLRSVLDLDGDGWNDVCELQGMSTASACERSALVRSGRTGEALWSASRFAANGERDGRDSLFRNWLETGLEDLCFQPDVDEDGAADLVVLSESLAVWSGANTKAIWVRDAKDLPRGTEKTLTRLPSTNLAESGAGRLAVGGVGGELHVFDAETGADLGRYAASEKDAGFHSRAVALTGSTAALQAADLDGDGAPDDVVCFWLPGGSDARSGEVAAFSSASGERLWSVQTDAETEPGFGSSAAAIGDMNGDGKCDYAIGAVSAGTVTLLSGSNGGVLWKRKRAPGFGASLATLPDLDGDGVSDLAAGLPPLLNSPGGAVAILKGSDGRQWLRVEPPE